MPDRQTKLTKKLDELKTIQAGCQPEATPSDKQKALALLDVRIQQVQAELIDLIKSAFCPE